MIEYTYLLNADNFYLCNMTDLKRTTFKTLKDDDKKTDNRGKLEDVQDDGRGH